MSAAGLLAELRDLGVQLEAAGERLRYDAPSGVLTPTLREAMAEQKLELLYLLTQRLCVDCGVAEREHQHSARCVGCTEQRAAAIPVSVPLCGPPPEWSCMEQGCKTPAADPDQGQRFYCTDHIPRPARRGVALANSYQEMR